MKRVEYFIYLIIAILTATIGYSIHHSIFWSICDFLFWIFAWIKWIILQEVNITIIKSAFQFFLQ